MIRDKREAILHWYNVGKNLGLQISKSQGLKENNLRNMIEYTCQEVAPVFEQPAKATFSLMLQLHLCPHLQHFQFEKEQTQIVVGSLCKFDIFGESALFVAKRAVRTATVTATEMVETLVLSRRSMRGLDKRNIFVVLVFKTIIKL